MVQEPGVEDYELLTRPRYSYSEADRLANANPGTSRRWLKGYKYWYTPEERRFSPPITPGRPDSQEAASFIDLIEVVAIDELKKRRFSLKSIRKINEYCQLYLGMDRPLVTETFKVVGRDVFIKASSGYLLDVLHQRGEQAWDEILEPFVETLDYKGEIARRWWPKGREFSVVVDPDYGFGFPVVAGSGVRTEIIAERARAGDDKEEIAYDFGVSVPGIEDALRYELPSAA